MNTELNFKLSQPIQVSVNGRIEESYELVLVAPSMKDRKQAAKLQQIIARAQMSFLGRFSQDQLDGMKSEDRNDSDDKSGDALKAMILGSDEDLEGFYEAFDTLAFRVCTVYDEVNLKQAHLEQMLKSDYEKMCFEYIGNFIE